MHMNIYIYHIEGAVFTTIWCSMYKVQSVDIYIYIFHFELSTFRTKITNISNLKLLFIQKMQDSQVL